MRPITKILIVFLALCGIFAAGIATAQDRGHDQVNRGYHDGYPFNGYRHYRNDSLPFVVGVIFGATLSSGCGDCDFGPVPDGYTVSNNGNATGNNYIGPNRVDDLPLGQWVFVGANIRVCEPGQPCRLVKRLYRNQNNQFYPVY